MVEIWYLEKSTDGMIDRCTWLGTSFVQPLASGMVKHRENTVQPPRQETRPPAKIAAARTLVTL
jgi:hypothetical protein